MDSLNQSIQLVIFDWAGTVIDFGSRAPAAAVTGVFASNGIEVTDIEAREPMGLSKREHLIAMLSMPSIGDRWKSVQGRDWNERDVDAMYEAFVPVQLEAIHQHASLVPGFLDVASQLRHRGVQVGGTTGYFQAAADAVLRSASEAGYEPDVNVCADDVPQGRPAPWMIYRAMEQLSVFPPSSVVKVGDTVADIQAGLAAGCWSVGVCDSSSLMGLSQTVYESLPPNERTERLNHAALAFEAAGAHATVGSISELPKLIHRIQEDALSYPHILET